MAETPTPDVAARTPRTILVAACLLLVEAATLVGLAVGELFSLDSQRLSLGVTNAAFFSLYAAALALSARGLLRLSRWSRSPIVLSQLIQLGIAWSFYGEDTIWVAAILAVVALIVLAIMFAPSTTALLFGTSRYEDG